MVFINIQFSIRSYPFPLYNNSLVHSTKIIKGDGHFQNNRKQIGILNCAIRYNPFSRISNQTICSLDFNNPFHNVDGNMCRQIDQLIIADVTIDQLGLYAVSTTGARHDLFFFFLFYFFYSDHPLPPFPIYIVQGGGGGQKYKSQIDRDEPLCIDNISAMFSHLAASVQSKKSTPVRFLIPPRNSPPPLFGGKGDGKQDYGHVILNQSLYNKSTFIKT